MAKNFLEYYINESSQEYVYKLKFACDDITDEQKNKLENGLAKFDLKNISEFTNTPIQSHPLDFPNVKNTRVHMVTVTLAYPASLDMLRQLVADYTGINLSLVAAYSQNDPREAYTDHANKLANNDWKKDYVPALGSDYEPSDHSHLYGEKLKTELMKQHAEKREARRIDIVTNKLIPEQVTDEEGIGGEDVGEAGGMSVLGGKK